MENHSSLEMKAEANMITVLIIFITFHSTHFMFQFAYFYQEQPF